MKLSFTMAFALVTMMTCSIQPLLADNQYLKQGIEAYNKGKYEDAVGMLGAAKSTESENPLLHYYLANALLRTNNKADAIREYKLARDLQPESQIAKYSEAALKNLTASATLTVPHGGSTGGEPQLPAKTVWKQPQLIAFTSTDSLSQSVEKTITSLHLTYGQRIAFIHCSKDSTDSKSRDLMAKYGITSFPTVILIDDQGKIAKKYTELISVDHLAEDVRAITLPDNKPIPFASAHDEQVAKYRQSQMDAVYQRIDSYQRALDSQIRAIDSETSQSITALPNMNSWRQNSGFIEQRQTQIQQLKDEQEKKKQDLRTELAHKETEWFAEAERSIDSFESRK